MVEVTGIAKECIRGLQEKGFVDVGGWGDHRLIKSPFAEGWHFEFHIYDDDVLVVYFKVERKGTIRMLGIHTHKTIPSDWACHLVLWLAIAPAGQDEFQSQTPP